MFYCLSVLFTTPCFGTVEKILDLSVQMFNACHGGKAAPSCVGLIGTVRASVNGVLRPRLC